MTPGYLERYVAQEGDTVKLICPIHGLPKPIIEWYQVKEHTNTTLDISLLFKIFQDDHMIQHSWERFRVNRRYLKIREVKMSDSGVFVCKGVNGFGSESVPINLVVRGKIEILF